ncbi:FMN-dependent NADH-azoreductase [Paenibacillus faecalis]|uniref:FMN-dependent NADH-azoreductase n=1 Tax=Paenibacillus faecalis TaxID=2079532 RepID=UPI000D10B8BB|nr:FMN-dependent NADH-azoreductase [Paenibacillus faecalis]
MAQLLYVKVNPKADEASYSTRLAQAFLEAYENNHPEDEIVTLDLYRSDIPFLDVDVFSAWGKFEAHSQLTPLEQDKVHRMNELTDQFLAADKVVFSAPFWNLSFPPMMKAYIDTICVAGKTFKYTEAGPIGLVPDKPVLLIEARGGHYSDGPAADMEFSKKYLKTIMNFLGIQNFQHLLIEELSVDPNKAEDIYHQGVQAAKNLAQRF